MKIVSLILAAALAAGCGAVGNAGAGPASSPPAAGPPADGGYFTDPRNIVEKSAGTIPCPDLEETSNVIGARDQVTCDDGNIVIRVRDNHAGVEDQIDLHTLTGWDLLTGQNWTVNAGPTVLRAAQKFLGGELVHTPCQRPDCQLEPSP
ncbi:MAG TPA: hypothetical protein VFU43_01735 [Streptosporangiaceae bacterium]|nr:hypothetical protein [Streptosporangiaceae bacterium]